MIEPNDTEERRLAGRDASTSQPLVQPLVQPNILPPATQDAQAENRGDYIRMPLPSAAASQGLSQVNMSRAVSKPSMNLDNDVSPPHSALFGSLRPVIEDLPSLDKDELIRRLRAKTKECEEIQQRNRILTMERDEYLEALRISEELRGVPTSSG